MGNEEIVHVSLSMHE